MLTRSCGNALPSSGRNLLLGRSERSKLDQSDAGMRWVWLTCDVRRL